MNKKDILKNVTRELRLVYYNDFLLKCGAITRREHRLMYIKILECTSVRRLVNDNV